MPNPRICSIEGCNKPLASRGFCQSHRRAFVKYGNPLARVRFKDRTCSVEECGKPHHVHGFCAMHYERNKKYGDPLFKKESHKDYLEKYAISFSGDECLIWPFKVSASNGYGFISHEGKQCGAHRYICQLAHGKPPSDSHEAAHDCGIRACVNHRHLRWATVKENMADKLKHGTDQRGEKQGSSKLTNEKVLIIRRLIKTHHPVAIAKMFGVSREAINSIRFSRTWRWLEQPKDSDL